MAERELPTALGLAVPVPLAAQGGNAAGPFPWEQIVKAKDHPGVSGLEFIFDTKSKAGSRAAAIKRRYLEVDRLANMTTQIRRVPSEIIEKLKYDTATEWWGVWVTYLGDLTEGERRELEAKSEQRRANRAANAQTTEDDDAAKVAAAHGRK